MNTAVKSLHTFLGEEGIKMTIVNKKRKGLACEVAFESPQVEDKQEFHRWIRREATDSFLMTSIRREEGVIKANVIPKSALLEIHQKAKKIGNKLEEVLRDNEPHFLEEPEVDVFEHAIAEMYEMSEQSESLLYQTIAPQSDTLETLCEFKEATNHIFLAFEFLIEEATHRTYHSLIEINDQIAA